MQLIDTIFADRLRHQPSERREFVLEKLQDINAPAAEYRSACSDYPYNHSVLQITGNKINQAIQDFVIVAWLTLDCPTGRNSEQIKDRFDEIKWIQEHHNMNRYTAVCFKKDSRIFYPLFGSPRHHDMSLSKEAVPDYIKGRYEQIAESFILSTPQEQQRFIQSVNSIAHHPGYQPNAPQRQRDE